MFSWLWGGGHEAKVPPIDPNNQSVIVDGKPHHRTSHLSKGPDLMQVDRITDCQICYDVLELGKKLSDNGPCLGARTGPNKEFEWMSYQEVIDKVHQFGSGLINSGNDPSVDRFVAIYSVNRPEWVISDFGCQAYSMVPVPLYETLGLDACGHIINECEIATVVCDKPDKLEKLLSLKSDIPSLRMVVVMEPVSAELASSAEAAEIKLMSFQDLLNAGKQNPKTPNPPGADEMYSICYTSGTTGNPKGVVLTHRAFLCMVERIHITSKPHFVLDKDDVHLSYLPMPHNFERTVLIMVFMRGVRVGCFSGDVRLLMDDLATLKPTFFPSVPRLLNRLHDTVHADVKNSFFKTKLLNWALASKLKDVNRHIYRRDTIWDKLIFHKIQDRLGGRVRIIITGSAPLSGNVLTFLRCAVGCMVMEGYGQTEAGAGLTFTAPGDNHLGHVGPPMAGIHIKLVDVPEMNYYAKDNIGEVAAKSSTLMTGYYKQPEKTAEALDEDGWLHTGDIGIWTECGALRIVDRKKNVFKLSQGEYVAVEKIENVYRNSPFIAQMYVDGNSLKPCLMAVIVPDEIFLAKWAPSNGFSSNLKEFCEAEGAKEVILEDMAAQAKAAGLNGFEKVKDIYLEFNMFSVENEMLTPTMKNKRSTLRHKYEKTIQELYTANDL